MTDTVEINHGTETDKSCPDCGKPMVVKRGKYGEFLACSGYPECKHTESLHTNGGGKPIGMDCPEDGCDGQLVEKVSKRGKTFYGCNRYPECTFASWDKPVPKSCPECGSPYLVEKTTKKLGTFLACPDRKCGYRQVD